jgi:hypothetical protein
MPMVLIGKSIAKTKDVIPYNTPNLLNDFALAGQLELSKLGARKFTRDLSEQIRGIPKEFRFIQGNPG